MSTTTRSSLSFSGYEWLGALGTAAVAIAIPVYALADASGVTYLGDSSYDTEFITIAWSWSWLLVLIPGAAAWFRPLLAWLLGFVVVVPQIVAAAVTVGRYTTSGWGDGLEGLSFLLPIGMTVLVAAQILIATAVRRARRAR